MQLKGIKKSTSLNVYLLSIKKTMNTLASIGSPIDSSEHISIILDGLPSEYNPLAIFIIFRTDPYIRTEIETLLATLENRLKRQKKEEHDSFAMQNIQANLAQIHSRFGKHQGGRFQGRGNINYKGNNFRGRSRSFGRNNNKGSRNFNNKPQCQICSKPGHTTLTCYQRFNPSYQESLSSSI
uniref:Retrovirus-related Pol polyprotein from transposon TNT 1-94 n=1 Tax=Cajanus cajan TaxID=3821 RepID=A0A151RJH5_CAJCA|nr:hypothetical protein KK1_035992 [Cajanus cajan]